MERMIPLWQGTPPGFEDSFAQPAPSVTLYPVKNSRGAVLVLAGGGYHYKADHEGGPVARRLNDNGIFAATLDYRVAPYHAPVPQWDALRSVQWLRKLAPEYGYQADHIGILGFSAGGHLAASAAYIHVDLPETEDTRHFENVNPVPDAAVLCYPVITMGSYTHRGSRDNLLGENADQTAIDYWSVEKQVSAGASPAFIWHTSDDGAVPVQNSMMLASSLADKNVPFSLHIWPHGHHGLGLAETVPDVSRWIDLAAEWLHGLGY